MPVFRMYFKLVKAKKVLILSYTIMFLAIFMAFYVLNKDSGSTTSQFQSTSVTVAIRDDDQSELSKNFVAYLSTKAKINNIGSDENAIKDALFYSDISYAIQIPEGFEAHFFEESMLPLHTTSRADSSSGLNTEQQINTYLEKLKDYHEVQPGLSNGELHERVMSVLDEKVQMELVNSEMVDGYAIGLGYYFNYLAYIFLSLILLSSGIIFIRILDHEIAKRNHISPISTLQFNAQLWLANVVFSLGIWVFFLVVIQVSMGGLNSREGFVFALNSLLFIIVCMGLSYLVSTLLAGRKNCEEALSGCSNLIGLGSSFLCGVFIPQAFLSPTVLIVGSFLPTFWYVKTNELLINSEGLTSEVWTQILQNSGILILFSLVFFVLAIFVSKLRASSNQL